MIQSNSYLSRPIIGRVSLSGYVIYFTIVNCKVNNITKQGKFSNYGDGEMEFGSLYGGEDGEYNGVGDILNMYIFAMQGVFFNSIQFNPNTFISQRFLWSNINWQIAEYWIIVLFFHQYYHLFPDEFRSASSCNYIDGTYSLFAPTKIQGAIFDAIIICRIIWEFDDIVNEINIRPSTLWNPYAIYTLRYVTRTFCWYGFLL